MKYSLKTLMIVVTLACVLLGGRIEYLRRMAAYHQRESACRNLINAINHAGVAEEYRQAILRPWTIVKEPPWLPENSPTYQAPSLNPPKP